MEWITEPDAWVALAMLSALEIVLGIDNIVFISIISGRLPEHQRARARRTGLLLAMASRIGLLLGLGVVMRLQASWFSVLGEDISGKDLVLIAGGLFLIAKSTREIHHRLQSVAVEQGGPAPQVAGLGGVVVQIALLDMVFSLDSVITAVGMARHIAVMILAVVLAVVVMVVFVDAICRFIERHPTLKMLALAFLILIGVALIAEGLDLHLPKGYIYFAMAFSSVVEFLNIKTQRQPRLPSP